MEDRQQPGHLSRPVDRSRAWHMSSTTGDRSAADCWDILLRLLGREEM